MSCTCQCETLNFLNLSIIVESRGKKKEKNITDAPGSPWKQEENELDISILI